MFIIEYRKCPKCCIQELDPSFLFDLHQDMNTNEHQCVTKMILNVTLGCLWGDFITIFWIAEYLQMPIYIWNKVLKRIMFECGIDF
jgi:hypothetical protein